MSVIDKYTIYLSTTDIELAQKIADRLQLEGGKIKEVTLFGGCSTIVVTTQDFSDTTLLIAFDNSKREGAKYGVRTTVAPFEPMQQIADELIQSNKDREKIFAEFEKYKQDARKEVQEIKKKIIDQYGADIFETEDKEMINILLGEFMKVFKNFDSDNSFDE